jgi:hypothetical protein
MRPDGEVGRMARPLRDCAEMKSAAVPAPVNALRRRRWVNFLCTGAEVSDLDQTPKSNWCRHSKALSAASSGGGPGARLKEGQIGTA